MSDLIERRLLEILRAAIEDERRSQKRYKKAALLSRKPEVKDMFSRLVAEECEHEKKLAEIYREVKKKLGLKIFKKDRKMGVAAAEVNQI